jgi:hypothetical protein
MCVATTVIPRAGLCFQALEKIYNHKTLHQYHIFYQMGKVNNDYKITCGLSQGKKITCGLTNILSYKAKVLYIMLNN